MSDSKITISSADAHASSDDRFARFKLIGWWDQQRLAAAKVLVVGAGALGNEIVKNLALLGVGNVLIADLDNIENSNLSRSVLYRAKDNGKPKAAVAAESAKEIYPGINVQAFVGNVVYDLGMGVYRWADVVIGGLDNREARLAINRACYHVNRPWIDGAIQEIQGTARVFAPDGPCYECTMSAADWKLLQHRRSCNLLSRPEMEGGKTPTTPTISSIIAGVQCQEAIKLLHGMDSIAGSGWVFNGLSCDAYTVQFQRKSDCVSHDLLDHVEALDESVRTITLRKLLELARKQVGADAELEFGRDVLAALECPTCKTRETLFTSLGKVTASQGACPKCGKRREPITFYKVRGNEDFEKDFGHANFLDMTAAAIGLPPMDIVIARSSSTGKSVGLEMSADAAAVLGPLSKAVASRTPNNQQNAAPKEDTGLEMDDEDNNAAKIIVQLDSDGERALDWD